MRHIKLLVFTTTFLLYSNIIYGQENDSVKGPLNNHGGSIFKDKRFSVALVLNLPYPFLYSSEKLYQKRFTYTNSFNYGCGAIITKYFNKLKLGSGLYFNTQNYHHQLETSNTVLIDKIVHINYPIIISYDRKISPVIGLIISKPIYYNNPNNEALKKEINTLVYHPSPGIGGPAPQKELNHMFLKSPNLLVGGQCNWKISEKAFINIELYYCYKFYNDVIVDIGQLEPRSSAYLTDGHSSIGVNIGFGFISGNNNKKVNRNY